MDKPLKVHALTTEEQKTIVLLRRGPLSLQSLAETLGLNLEQAQNLLRSLNHKVGIVPLFRYNTLRYGLAE